MVGQGGVAAENNSYIVAASSGGTTGHSSYVDVASSGVECEGIAEYNSG